MAVVVAAAAAMCRFGGDSCATARWLRGEGRCSSSDAAVGGRPPREGLGLGRTRPGSLEFQLSGVPCTVLRAAPVIAARQQLAETRFRGAGAGQIASACRTFWVVRLARVSERGRRVVLLLLYIFKIQLTCTEVAVFHFPPLGKNIPALALAGRGPAAVRAVGRSVRHTQRGSQRAALACGGRR